MSDRLIERVPYDVGRHAPRTDSAKGWCSYWGGCPDKARARWSICEVDAKGKPGWYAVCDACLHRAEGLDEPGTRSSEDKLLMPRQSTETQCTSCFRTVPKHRIDATGVCSDCR